MNYGLLFLVGFLTSFHCVGMCGPLVIGYTAKSAKLGADDPAMAARIDARAIGFEPYPIYKLRHMTRPAKPPKSDESYG
jgi:hypothetical protein